MRTEPNRGERCPWPSQARFIWSDDLTALHLVHSRLQAPGESGGRTVSPASSQPHQWGLRIFKRKTRKKNDPFWYHGGPKIALALGFSFLCSACWRSPLPSVNVQHVKKSFGPLQRWGAPGPSPGNVSDT